MLKNFLVKQTYTKKWQDLKNHTAEDFFEYFLQNPPKSKEHSGCFGFGMKEGEIDNTPDYSKVFYIGYDVDNIKNYSSKIFESLRSNKFIKFAHITYNNNLRFFIEFETPLQDEKTFIYNYYYYLPIILKNNIYKDIILSNIDKTKDNGKNLWFVGREYFLNTNNNIKLKVKQIDQEQNFTQTKETDIQIIEILKNSGEGFFSNYNDFLKICFAFKSANYDYNVLDEILKKSDNYNKENNEKIYNALKPQHITFKTAYYYAKLCNPTEFGKITKISNSQNQQSLYKLMTDEDLKKIKKLFLKRYFYNTIEECVFDNYHNIKVRRDDLKTFIRNYLEKHKYNTRYATHIYQTILNSKKNFVRGNFKIELGIQNLKNKNKNLVKINNIFYKTDEDDIFFNMPAYKEKNDKLWEPLINLFEDKELAKQSISLFFKNIKLSYLGQERPHPIFLVLQGKQGVGKDYYLTRFFTSFIPKQYVKSANAVSITDERHFRKLENTLILHFSEMQYFDKEDTNAIKSFITASEINYRVLGTNNFVKMKNLINCIGTTNQSDFSQIYRDSTGERRFVMLKLKNTVTVEDIKNALKKYNFDSTCLYETINENDTIDIDRILKSQEEIRYKPIEEVFIEDNIEYFKKQAKLLNHLTADDIYNKYIEFARDNNLKQTETKNKIWFMRIVKEYLQKNGFYYEKNHRKYFFEDTKLEENIIDKKIKEEEDLVKEKLEKMTFEEAVDIIERKKREAEAKMTEDEKRIIKQKQNEILKQNEEDRDLDKEILDLF